MLRLGDNSYLLEQRMWRKLRRMHLAASRAQRRALLLCNQAVKARGVATGEGVFASATSTTPARNVFHRRRGRCGVTLLSALLPALCIDGQSQRDSSRAWRGCAGRGVAARHNNARIVACVGRHVWACVL